MGEYIWFKHKEDTFRFWVSDEGKLDIPHLATHFNLNPGRLRIGKTILSYDSATGAAAGFGALLVELRTTDSECGKSEDKALQLEGQPAGVAPSQEQLQEMIAQQVQQQLAQFGVLRDFFLHILDYSEGVISTAPSTANFKNRLIHQYSDRLDGEHGPMLWCMLLQMRLPKSLVIGSHLWKRAWHQHMWVLDLPAEEIDSIRNGLLLFKPIEWAFDTSRLCFELDDFGQYVPHLLDGRLQDTKLLDKLEELIQPQVLDSELKAFLSATLKVRDTGIDLTFGHLPTYWLKSAPNKEAPAPWSRVLEFQARRASLKAAELHWPHEPVTFITGSPYAARAAILQWFADTEEQAAAAGNPVAVVQQLP